MSTLVGIVILVGFFALVIWLSLFFGVFPDATVAQSGEDTKMMEQLKPFAGYFLAIGLLSFAIAGVMIYFRF